jgi:flagellar biosynthesis protein FlhF
VPLRIAHNAHEIHEHIAELHACDLIFVDTMGRNFLDQQQALELATMLDGVDFDVRYLVISFSSRFTEALETAEVLKIVGYDALLLTKNDEAKLPALLFSLIDQLQKPLSYLTIGQEVPNDLMVAHVDAIMELFAGGDHDGRSSGDVAEDYPREDAKSAVN